jgi:zinc transporter 9
MDAPKWPNIYQSCTSCLQSEIPESAIAGSSAKAVYAAIATNSVLSVIKLVAFGFTGSGAMLSEGIHSLADVGNQSLLALGIKKARKDADEDHPYGYGRDAFVWAMISAVGIFFLGCGFTLYHGLSSLWDHLHGHSHPIESVGVAVGVLVFSALLEGWTFWIALVEVRKSAKAAQMSLRQYTQEGSDPMGVAVLLEDAAAVLGVLIALSCIGMYQLTGNPIWDSIGSIIIAILLGLVAVFLVKKNRSALLGRNVSGVQQSAVMGVLSSDPVVERFHDVKATVMSAESFRFKAEVDFDGRVIAQKLLDTRDMAALHAELRASPEALQAFLVEFGEEMLEALGDEINRIEERIQAEVPAAKHVDLEVD